MIIFAFLIYILLVVLIGASALVYLSPILMGLIIIIIANAVSKFKRGKMAPVLWNIVTVGVTIFATGMLWKDIFDDAIDTGSLPFNILSLYGLGSLIVFAISEVIRQNRERKEYQEVIAREDLPEKTQVFDKEYKKLLDEELPTACDWKRQETREDYPAPDYDAIHTYCEVAFDDSGRTYYYRTRNPELEVGDTVYVPFGYNAPKKIGVIVSMEDFEGHNVPFPLEKTKFIIGKV